MSSDRALAESRDGGGIDGSGGGGTCSGRRRRRRPVGGAAALLPVALLMSAGCCCCGGGLTAAATASPLDGPDNGAASSAAEASASVVDDITSDPAAAAADQSPSAGSAADTYHEGGGAAAEPSIADDDPALPPTVPVPPRLPRTPVLPQDRDGLRRLIVEAQRDLVADDAADEDNDDDGNSNVDDNNRNERDFENDDSKHNRGENNDDEDDDEALRRQAQNDDFLRWCRHVLGIKTSLAIRHFDYVDPIVERRILDDAMDDDLDREAMESVLVSISDSADDDVVDSAGGVDFSDAESSDDLLDSSDRRRTRTSLAKQQQPTMPTTKVRGLAATTPIVPGDVLITIPFHALLTTHTTIDHDPVLSTLIGPEVRSKFGWDGDDAPYYEVPLLIVAVLYHVDLGSESPLARYIDALRSAPVDGMPFLWDSKRLRGEFGGAGDNSSGVGKIVGEIKDEIRDMYRTVLGALVREWPDAFGPPPVSAEPEGRQAQQRWAYSYEKFRWAFAMVNSRHWHVPVRDLDEDGGEGQDDAAAGRGREARMRPPKSSSSSSSLSSSSAETDAAVGATVADVSPPVPAPTSFADDVETAVNSDGIDLPPHEGNARTLSSVGTDGGIASPPAEQPTDAFVDGQVGGDSRDSRDADGDDDDDARIDDASKGRREEEDFDAASTDEDEALSTDEAARSPPAASPAARRSHSFLAPLADLLNFGPPCTRGTYDPATHTFNVVATCPFLPGQEVTFYYSDDCEDVIVANYGFTHPMVPRCPSAEDWRERADVWRRHADELEASLTAAYDEMDRMEGEVDELAGRLAECEGTGGAADGLVGGGGGERPSADLQAAGEGGSAKPSGKDEGDGGGGSQPQVVPTRRTLRRDSAHHRELRGSVHADGEGGADGTAGATEGHGGVRRMWHLDGRDVGDSL